MLNSIYKSTKKYLLDLVEMEGLAAAGDQEFFRYVVVQEEIQIESLALLVEGRSLEATAVLTNFLKEGVPK